MSARFKTREWTLTGSADSLATILNSLHDVYVSSITIRAAHTNVGNVTWEDEDGASGGFVQPGEGASFDLAGKFVKTDQITFTGTADDVLNVTVIG